MGDAGKVLVAAGLFMVFLGVVLMISGKVPFPGRLPGDLVLQRRNLTLYVPLATCLLISLAATIIMRILGR